MSKRITFAEFYLQGPNGPTPMAGGDSVYNIDRRLSKPNMIASAKKRADMLAKGGRKIVGLRLHSGTSYTDNNPTTPYIPYEPKPTA